MTDAVRERIAGAWQRINPADRRVNQAGERTNVVEQLTGADYVSMAALFVAWGSALLFLAGEPNWALLVMFGAFGLDKLDGWYARRTGESSSFGRQVDSFIDIFAYLLPAALLFHLSIAPTVLASLVVGFLILACGGLRLIRHNNEGFGSDGEDSYYHGTTVVHTNLVVVANYALLALFDPWNGWLATVLVLPACPLMVSDYKAYKTATSHALAALAGALAGSLALAMELGWV